MTNKRKTSALTSASYRIPGQAPGAACPFDPATAARLAARPVDPRRRLPVPAMNSNGDFLSINPGVVLTMAMAYQCAVCGQQIPDGEYAFMSGPHGAKLLLSPNPPAHEGCLLAAVVLCPYISRENTVRATGDRAAALNNDPRQELRKPQVWTLGVTDYYQVETDHTTYVHLRLAPYLRQRRYRYAEGRLYETAL